MKGRQTNRNPARISDPDLVEEVLALLDGGQSVRREFEGGRIHIDRALPFLCVHLTEDGRDSAALVVASANASYLLAADEVMAVPLIEAIGTAMAKRFGAFLLIDVGEFERDRLLSEDAPYLPPFEVTLSAPADAAAQTAMVAFASAVERAEVKYRSPRIEKRRAADDPCARLGAIIGRFPCITVRFAPIYRASASQDIYPELRGRVVANMLDAGLQAVAAFLDSKGVLELATHRALGRKVFIDAVSRADRAIDDIVASFDFLLAVTPINAESAWREFERSGFERTPQFLYRPLTMQVDVEKRKLFSIAFDNFEDPVLFDLYREKQQELDLQLSMLSVRETPRFVEIGRALYGSVQPALLDAATDILAKTLTIEDCWSRGRTPDGQADCHEVRNAALAMIEAYRGEHPDFEAVVEIRDDLPAGLMVSCHRLLISRSTMVPRRRVEALLSHEVGVHLLTYFNGSAQGLRLFRSGLAGYERVQEGLAVFAEYLVGGMTAARLRLIAARVVACAAMLDGATFPEIFRGLVRDHGFTGQSAFNLTLRLYRGGGLPKDAIYLHGLLQVLDHLAGGGSLDPFWMGKIAASHFGTMQELATRGLLRAPAIAPAFLSHPKAKEGLEKARLGLSPVQMIRS